MWGRASPVYTTTTTTSRGCNGEAGGRKGVERDMEKQRVRKRKDMGRKEINRGVEKWHDS